MERPQFSPQHHSFMVTEYHRSNSVTAVLRRFRQVFPNVRCPTRATFYLNIRKYRETGSPTREFLYFWQWNWAIWCIVLVKFMKNLNVSVQHFQYLGYDILRLSIVGHSNRGTMQATVQSTWAGEGCGRGVSPSHTREFLYFRQWNWAIWCIVWLKFWQNLNLSVQYFQYLRIWYEWLLKSIR